MSYITLSKQALIHNLNVLSKRIDCNKIIAVLKDNAYGHGLLEIAAICASYGIKSCAVRTSKEAAQVNELFDFVLVLSDDFGNASNNTCFAVNSFVSLKQQPKKRKIHLKLDTGMHRNGIVLDELNDALTHIKNNKIELLGVFSHLRNADELDTSWFWQEQNFETARHFINDFCSQNNMQKPKYHLHNSAGALRKKNLDNFDFIRPGIALYGYMDSNACDANLRPVLKLYADKISDKRNFNYSKFGYGGAGKSEAANIGIYDVGYSDGFWRLTEQHCYSISSGNNLVGRVSMDSCFIESTEDTICIIDDAKRLADITGTISYDILVKLNSNIKRIVVD